MTSAATRSTNGLAIAGFVLGIIAAVLTLVLHAWFLALLPALLAVVFGFVGMAASRRAGRGRKRAAWAIVLGFVALLFPFVFAAVTGSVWA